MFKALRTATAISPTHQYDQLHRLIESNSTGGPPVLPMALEYSYDDTTGAGPLHSPANLTVDATPHQLDYDANGNLTAGWDFSDPDTPTQRKISYDAANMAADITLGDKQTTFLYDGDGKRVKKVQGGSSTFYIDDVFEVKDGSPTRYIFANNLRVAMQENNTLTYFYKDHLGSSSVMTNAEGKEVSSAEYLPYGLTRGDVGITQSGYQFTDQELDTETGLYNYDAGLYDPIVGQLLRLGGSLFH
jgi:uncharacterized protein RhaS with RHS repeats